MLAIFSADAKSRFMSHMTFRAFERNRGSGPKGPIATFYCDVPTEKVIFKGEQMHVRI